MMDHRAVGLTTASAALLKAGGGRAEHEAVR
jgi:hypothetical protein